jgi:hypothetical protein
MIDITRQLKLIFHKILRPSGKYNFLSKMPSNTNILDIGSGKSPNRIKPLFPKLHYTGLDITDHFVEKNNMSDSYILTNVSDFIKTLNKNKNTYLCTISSHNLEHCEDRELVLTASISTVKVGGFLYMSFPSVNTVNLPKGRKGTLNYFDDPTHKTTPPDPQEIIKVLNSNHFEVIKFKQSYKPAVLWLLGFILEPISFFTKKVMPGSLQFWGFETIIIAKKLPN